MPSGHKNVNQHASLKKRKRKKKDISSFSLPNIYTIWGINP